MSIVLHIRADFITIVLDILIQKKFNGKQKVVCVGKKLF